AAASHFLIMFCLPATGNTPGYVISSGGQLAIKEWVEQMQQELVTLVETASGVKSFTQIFLNNRKLYSVETNYAGQLVASAARNIEKLLLKRSMALETLATAAERFQMEHQWKNEFGVILDANETEGRKNRIRPEFKEDPSFRRLISYNHTAVHIPTDIYEGSTIVLNELNWTEALEDVFKKNREEDPTLLWQVFGSATGLARYYPASPWMDSRKMPSKIDLYDVRRRPWYIQGAASPKDMLILVDAPASRALPLSPGQFNTGVSKAACFDHLVQANVRNKKILKDAVQNITAKGITNYKEGFKFAFEQLSYSNVTRANCNKIIMLFTDGGEERAQEIFEKYNPDKKVRIFTFSVGQHNYDKGPIQWMACANKGYYYEIPSIGAIRINTQEYLDVLGRPMVLADKQAKQVQWTNVYLDALELGLVITGTLPVFNKTRTRDDKDGTQKKNQLILGVMGIDVSLEDIKRLTPRFTIGPNGYYFAIDPNGYVLLHPNLQPKNPKFQEPVTLDFLDAELENDIKVQIRRLMIDGETGERTLDTLVKSQDERYIDRGVRTYTWAPVNGTDYSLALVLPEYSKHYIQARIGDTITQAKFSETLQQENFEEYGYTFIAPREYCKDLKLSENNTQFLMDFNEYIDRKTPNNPTCEYNGDEKHNRITQLLVCRSLQRYPTVCCPFVTYMSDIVRVSPPPLNSAGEFWTENAETYESSFYKRSLDNDIYIFTAPFFNSTLPAVDVFDSGILASRAVELNIEGVKLKPHVDCVILDDGGFLLMSNQDEYVAQTGRFFGEVDPILMINLVNTSLYSFNKTYDYQSVCNPERESKAAAGLRSVYVPTVADILNIGWWATAAEELSEVLSKESCITEQTQYFFEGNEKSFSGVLDCGNCSRMYLAEKLLNTNLVFLITDAKGTCLSCDPKPLIQAEQLSTGPDPCKLAENPRYRKGPDVCFDNDVNEDDSDCGGASGLSASLWPMAGIQLVLFVWLASGPSPCPS
uniref:Calcium voltage-gated channel auxiliary subunit alpha2delta 1 n=1 Tax=Scleropages formosus TaxID=113540 RepID=A0A8C9T173_SCLFO